MLATLHTQHLAPSVPSTKKQRYRIGDPSTPGSSDSVVLHWVRLSPQHYIGSLINANTRDMAPSCDESS